MPNMLTTQEAAALLNLDDSGVRKLAARVGVGRKAGRDWRFTERDVAKMAAARRPPGRPKK